MLARKSLVSKRPILVKICTLLIKISIMSKNQQSLFHRLQEIDSKLSWKNLTKYCSNTWHSKITRAKTIKWKRLTNLWWSLASSPTLWKRKTRRSLNQSLSVKVQSSLGVVSLASSSRLILSIKIAKQKRVLFRISRAYWKERPKNNPRLCLTWFQILY